MPKHTTSGATVNESYSSRSEPHGPELSPTEDFKSCSFCGKQVKSVNFHSHSSLCPKGPVPCVYCGRDVKKENQRAHEEKCAHHPKNKSKASSTQQAESPAVPPGPRNGKREITLTPSHEELGDKAAAGSQARVYKNRGYHETTFTYLAHNYGEIHKPTEPIPTDATNIWSCPHCNKKVKKENILRHNVMCPKSPDLFLDGEYDLEEPIVWHDDKRKLHVKRDRGRQQTKRKHVNRDVPNHRPSSPSVQCTEERRATEWWRNAPESLQVSQQDYNDYQGYQLFGGNHIPKRGQNRDEKKCPCCTCTLF